MLARRRLPKNSVARNPPRSTARRVIDAVPTLSIRSDPCRCGPTFIDAVPPLSMRSDPYRCGPTFIDAVRFLSMRSDPCRPTSARISHGRPHATVPVAPYQPQSPVQLSRSLQFCSAAVYSSAQQQTTAQLSSAAVYSSAESTAIDRTPRLRTYQQKRKH